ncbi:Ig-like domain-containing protein [Flavobacterium nackdongense]|nr:Ig-like domain-containing protein [Flavobacterium nackdongense]
MKKIYASTLLLLCFLTSSWSQNIVYPWRATTAIVKTGQTFEVWFNAASGQTVNSIELKSPYITLNTSINTVTGNWTYDALSGNKYNQKITVTVPTTAPADRYDLVLLTSSGNITSFGGVKVLKEFKSDYYIMHWSDGHLYQNGYDTNLLMKRKDKMIDIANIIDAEIIIETGDNMYNVRNNPSREVDYFIGNTTQGTKGMAKATAATFMTPGDHEGLNGNDYAQGTVQENSDFFNDYYGLQFHYFKYGNARFMNLNNAWGLSATNNGVHQYEVDESKAWLDGAGSGGNFLVTSGHCYDRIHKFINDYKPLDLVLAGDKHHSGPENPWAIATGSPNIAYIVNSIRDHFQFNIFKVNNSAGTFTKPAGPTAMINVLNSGDEDVPSTWVTNLNLSFSSSNTGTVTSNTATIDNKFDFPITGAKVRFVVPKGNEYTVTNGTITQEFDGTTYHIVDVATDLSANATKAISISKITTIPVTSVSLTPATATIIDGNTQQLSATIAPTNASNKTVSWSSSNTAVATVTTSGLVTAIAAGTATITVTTQDGSKTDTSVITVTVPVTSVSVSPATATIIDGNTQQLTATIAPTNASNKTVSWSSSNTAVATVNASGLVTAVAAGTATITVTTQDGSKPDTSVITVTVPVTSVSVSPATATIIDGNTQQLTATIAPTNASNKTVSWSSSNTAVATVNASGLVTAIAAGTATITVTTQDGSKTDTSVITVTAVIAGPQVLQAENAAYSGAVVATNQTGYNGSGFIDFTNNTGDYLQWTVNVPTAGSYDLSIRYSLLTAGRPLELKVNGTVKVASLDFPATGSWSTWSVLTSTQTLIAGSNTIRLTTIGSNGGNIDELTVAPVAKYLDTCDAITNWGSASSNAISYFTTDKKQGSGCIQMIGSTTEEFKKVFSTPFNSGTTIANGALSFWYYVSDVSKIGTVRVELGSGGAADVNELSWALSGLANGWNQIILNTADASIAGTPNMSALNWFRIYDTKTASITTRIDAIQVMDASIPPSTQRKANTLGTVANERTNAATKSITVYPNPYKDGTLSLDILGFEASKAVQLKITNLLGQVIHQEILTDTAHKELNLSGRLNEAVYFISLEDGDNKIVKKLMVK